MAKILCMDIGSTGVRARLYHGNSQKKAGPVSTIPYDGNFVAGKRHLNTVRTAIKQCLAGLKGLNDVSIISHGSMSPSLVSWEKNKNAEIIAHDDRRSITQALELKDKLSAQDVRKIGNVPVPGGISMTSLAWMLKHLNKSEQKQITGIGHLSSWLSWELTGNNVMDYSHGSFTGLMNIQTKRWYNPVVNKVGLPASWLPRLQDAGDVAGKVNTSAAKAYGLPENAIVLSGIIDTSAAILKSPLKAGTLIHSMGSTDVLAMVTDKPVNCSECLTRHLGTDRIGKSHYLAVVTMAAGGSLLNWTHNMFFGELSDTEFYKIVSQTMRSILNGKVATELSIKPHLAGSRLSVSQPTGTISGLSLNHNRQDILIGILSAYREQMTHGLKVLTNIKRPRNEVFVTGGGSKLGKLLHTDWPARFTYQKLNEGNLDGLALLGGLAISNH